jgi:predicted metal-binding protein
MALQGTARHIHRAQCPTRRPFAGPSRSPHSHIPYACLALALFTNTHTLQGIEPSLRPHQSPLDSHGEETVFPPLAGPEAIDLGNYQRKAVSNVDSHPLGRAYFDMGLRLVSSLGCGRRPGDKHARAMSSLQTSSSVSIPHRSCCMSASLSLSPRQTVQHLSYQHEMAAKCFLACLHYCPYAVLAHGLIALCHAPNYVRAFFFLLNNKRTPCPWRLHEGSLFPSSLCIASHPHPFLSRKHTYQIVPHAPLYLTEFQGRPLL